MWVPSSKPGWCERKCEGCSGVTVGKTEPKGRALWASQELEKWIQNEYSRGFLCPLWLVIQSLPAFRLSLWQQYPLCGNSDCISKVRKKPTKPWHICVQLPHAWLPNLNSFAVCQSMASAVQQKTPAAPQEQKHMATAYSSLGCWHIDLFWAQDELSPTMHICGSSRRSL